eukprot:GHVN01094461.1.p1 GENE.GHVN01094461.1~~GHVN01094461.1.p1  ORF type:complete len:503 (+),score=81.62 GHVN01094461.1:941-2449(+)
MKGGSADVVDTSNEREETVSEDADSASFETNKGWCISSVCVTNEEVKRLAPGGWLDDTLIDFFLKFIALYLIPEKSQYYIFSSFFFTNLTSQKGEHVFGFYDRVKKWTKRLQKGIWRYDYIFVPVCESNHWYLAIICHPSGAVESEASSLLPPPTIVCLDSGGCEAEQIVLQKLAGYIHLEYHSKSEGDSIRNLSLQGNVDNGQKDNERLAEWEKKWDWVPRATCPEQQNGNDCGVFLLEYVSQLTRTDVRIESLPAVGRSQRNRRITSKFQIDQPRTWFEQKAITHRRAKLKEMLDFMRLNPQWQDNTAQIEELKEMFVSEPPSSPAIQPSPSPEPGEIVPARDADSSFSFSPSVMASSSTTSSTGSTSSATSPSSSAGEKQGDKQRGEVTKTSHAPITSFPSPNDRQRGTHKSEAAKQLESSSSDLMRLVEKAQITTQSKTSPPSKPPSPPEAFRNGVRRLPIPPITFSTGEPGFCDHPSAVRTPKKRPRTNDICDDVTG